VPHVELSLSGSVLPEPESGSPDGTLDDPVSTWAQVVVRAAEPCLILDSDGVVIAASPTCRSLLGFPEDEEVVGRGLLDGLLELIDFTAARGQLAEWELERIPPLLALSTGGLARGLMRIRVGDLIRTVDAITTPLWNGGQLAGSLTFFCRI